MVILSYTSCDTAGAIHNSSLFSKGPDDKIKNALAGYLDMHVLWRGNPEAEFSELAAIIHTAASKKKKTS
jgi:hypothetical protein